MKNLYTLLILLATASSAHAMQKGGSAPFTSPKERSQSERDLFESKEKDGALPMHSRGLSKVGKAVIAYKKKTLAQEVLKLAKEAEKAKNEISQKNAQLEAAKTATATHIEAIKTAVQDGKISRKESEDLEHAASENLVRATVKVQDQVGSLTEQCVATKVIINDLNQAAESAEYNIPSVRTHKKLDSAHVFDKDNPTKVSPVAREALQDPELHEAMRSYIGGNENALSNYAVAHDIQ